MALDFDWHTKNIRTVRWNEVKILKGQRDLHIYFPMPMFDDPEVHADMGDLIRRVDQEVSRLHANWPHITALRAMKERYAGAFKEFRVQLAFRESCVGLGVFIELNHGQSVKATAPVLDELESMGWTVKDSNDDPDIGWRNFNLKRDDGDELARQLHVRISIGYGNPACRFVETGETKPVMKLQCADEAA